MYKNATHVLQHSPFKLHNQLIAEASETGSKIIHQISRAKNLNICDQKMQLNQTQERNEMSAHLRRSADGFENF